MTHENLAEVIERVRAGTAFENNIYIRPLLGNVAMARVWTPDSSYAVHSEYGYTFYLVYSGGECVAAFLWMGHENLHVFVRPEFRGRGIMSNAMREIILPHLFLTNERMTEQRAEFSSPESQRLLEQVGFTVIDDELAVLPRSRCAVVDFPSPANVMLSELRGEVLRKRFGYMAGLIEMTRYELETCKIDPDLCYDLEDMRDQLRNYSGRMLDLLWAQKERYSLTYPK